MVLLPGCPCCAACRWPQDITPDSIEVVIEDGGSASYTVTNADFGLTTVEVDSIAGTYSLTTAAPGGRLNESYRYTLAPGGVEVFSFGLWGGWSGGLLDVAMTLRRVFAVRAFRHNISGRVVGSQCTASTGVTVNYPSARSGDGFPIETSADNARILFANRSIAFESGCCLPANLSMDVLYKTDRFEALAVFDSPTSHTFPISTTALDWDGVTSRNVIGFTFSIRIVSIKYIYGSTATPILTDTGQATCSEM